MSETLELQYLEFLQQNRKTAEDARYRADALIRPKLGNIEATHLKADQIRKWLIGVAKAAPRLRTRKDEKQKYRAMGTDGESIRRRRASANRTLTVLKAALNRAWREGKVSSNAEWHRVEPFENVDAARIHYLSVAEAQRLINTSDPDFRNVIIAALQTGARYGELMALQVHDFNADAGTVAIRTSKTGEARHVMLTEEGAAFFRQLSAGRSGSDLMLLKANGGAWLKSHQKRPMIEACKRANIKPAVSFHALRHTWASLAVMAGVPLLVVARNLGHADTKSGRAPLRPSRTELHRRCHTCGRARASGRYRDVERRPGSSNPSRSQSKAALMRAPVGPAQLPRLDLKAPPGWYPIDNFLACFEPVRGSERPLSSDDKPTFDELEPGPELELFRWDVDRLVRLALLRTERDDTDLPEARREAAGLLAQLIEIRPALGDLVARTTGDAAVMAAKLSPAFAVSAYTYPKVSTVPIRRQQSPTLSRSMNRRAI